MYNLCENVKTKKVYDILKKEGDNLLLKSFSSDEILSITLSELKEEFKPINQFNW